MTVTRMGLLLPLLMLYSLPARADAGKDVFLLTATLRDPYNPRLVLSLPVTLGQPFSVMFTNGPVVTTLSGTLNGAACGGYALPLKISEGPASHPGYTLQMTYPLRLDKAEDEISLDGQIVFEQTLLLTRLKAAECAITTAAPDAVRPFLDKGFAGAYRRH